MRTWKSELHFNLKWWGLDLSADEKWTKYLEAGLSGMTVVGCSDQEVRRIKSYAAERGIHKLSRVAAFESDLEPKFMKEVNNGHGLDYFIYMERELCVFDTKDRLLEFELFLDGLPKREFETFVRHRSTDYVKELCSRHNHRMLPSKIDDTVAVSTDSKTLFLQLNLISVEEEDAA